MWITGTTENSRLSELKKYAVGVPFTQQYFGNGSFDNDGVDYNLSQTIQYVVYYIGGIRYIDQTLSGGKHTTFGYYSDNEYNFTDDTIFKNPNKDKIISNPKINDDVFITRSNQSAYEGNYRLEYVNNMVDLLTYASGKYFNIINNA